MIAGQGQYSTAVALEESASPKWTVVSTDHLSRRKTAALSLY
jgi:hypothetical protein